MLPPTVVPSEGEQKRKKQTDKKYNKKPSKNHTNIHPNAII